MLRYDRQTKPGLVAYIRHPARKRSESIFTTPEPARGSPAKISILTTMLRCQHSWSMKQRSLRKIDTHWTFCVGINLNWQSQYLAYYILKLLTSKHMHNSHLIIAVSSFPVSEMTYTVSSGTLNLVYHTIVTGKYSSTYVLYSLNAYHL